MSYDPGALITSTTYYWAITAIDGLSVSVGATWHFTTIATAPPNQAPYTPSAPIPADGATGVPITQTLSWQGGDPDGDPVTYTVALGTVTPPAAVATDVTIANYTPGDLITSTTYYWVITATDGISTVVGPTWHFTTTDVESGCKVYLPLVLKQ